MDIYLSSLVLGGLGLGTMAIAGMSHGSGHGHAHGHADGHAHSDGDGGGHGHVHAPGHGHGPGHSHGEAHTHAHELGSKATWLLAWPRLMFGFLLGVGATGIALKPILFEPVTIATAVLGGLFFQRFIITPLWNFTLRFASTPAVTSEGADEATAVTGFNAEGEGLVAIEVDGQVLQVLGQLKATDLSLGVVVRAGQRLHVEEVNTANNRCIVSAL